jgi:predicted chitinase
MDRTRCFNRVPFCRLLAIIVRVTGRKTYENCGEFETLKKMIGKPVHDLRSMSNGRVAFQWWCYRE